MKKEKVLVLFSGGRDSFLASCKLVEEGNRIYLVNFSNGAVLNKENAKHGAERIISKYGSDKVKFLGTKDISSIWRTIFIEFYNMKSSKVLKQFGELTTSQFNCLSCRSAMYVWCILYAKKNNIQIIKKC